jgi:outer membrane protein assembly factor BamB
MRLSLTVTIAIGIASPVFAEQWPQFRGPSGQAVTDAKELPDQWSKDKNLAWTAAVPGVAWSQPVVWGDKIFVTTAVTENQSKPKPGGGFGGGRGGFGGRGRAPEGPGGADRPRDDAAPQPRPEGPRPGGRPGGNQPGGGRPGGPGGGGFGGFGRGAAPPNQVYQWKVLCLDTQSGNVLWEKLAHEGKPTIATHSTNTYASETPVTDGERVYAYFGMTGLYCYDLAGKELWSKKFESHPMMMGWGTGSSPVLHGDLVFVQCDNEEKSYLVAFNKKMGDEVWRKSRDEKSNWSTPYIWENKVRTELVTCGGTQMRSYDPSTGEILWTLGGQAGRANASPIGDKELLYVGTGGMGFGGGGPLSAVKAGAKGDITPKGDKTTSEGIAWSVNQAGPKMASPLLYDGCLYVLDQRGGIVLCYDAKTGRQHYKERLTGAKGFTASPWAANGKVFCLDEEGQTFVLKAGPKFQSLGKNKLDDMFWSSAAIAGDRLLLRGVDKLYCIAK